MFITSDPTNPIYLVSPTGDYIRDGAGNLRVFEGEAIDTHPSGYLVDTQGNFLLKDNAYIPAPTPTIRDTAPHNAVANTAATGTIPTTVSPVPSVNTAAAPVYPPTYYTPTQNQQITLPTQSTSDDENKKTGKRWVFIVIGVLLALALGVGGGFLAYHFFGNNSSDTPSTMDTDSPHARDIITDNPTTYIHLPADAYQGAGTAEVPSGANSLSMGDIIISPTGNLACGFNDSNMLCQAGNWEAAEIYGTNPNECTEDYCYPYNGVSLQSSGNIELISGPGGVNGTAVAVPYGTVVYSGDFVCASEENGMTCWSRESGHGFFINRDGYKSF